MSRVRQLNPLDRPIAGCTCSFCTDMRDGGNGHGFFVWLLALIVALSVLAFCIFAPGCVSGGYKSWDRTTTTETFEKAPAGDPGHPADLKSVLLARVTVREKGRSATYTDSTEAAAGAAKFVGQMAGGEGLLGFVANLPIEGAAAGGGIGLGLLGWLGRSLVKNARAKGRDEGWDDREKAGAVQQALPASGGKG